MNELRDGVEIDSEPVENGLKIMDIYYAIFRHKGKIALLSALACVLALGMVKFMPPAYESEVKLLIHYVMETKSPSVRGAGSDSQIMSPDARGESIINTEMEILRSFE